MDNNFREIKTEYDYFTLFIYGKKIPLIYRIRQYQKLKNQDKKYIKKLKQQGIKLKHFKQMNKDESVTVVYYKPYCIRLTPLKYRQILIDRIMGKLHELGHSLKNEIEVKWFEKHCHKTTSIELMDKEAIILDTLASYYIGGLEGRNVLNQKTWRAVFKEECASFNELHDSNDDSINDDNVGKAHKSWEIGQYNKKRLQDFLKKNKLQIKHWKKTTTYKLNNVFTFNNHKDEVHEWDWINWRWMGLHPDTFVNREGVINPEQPYIAKWCYVDGENEFEFEGNKYYIESDVESYKYKMRKNRKGEIEWDWSSDQILVIATCSKEFVPKRLTNGKYLKQPEVNKKYYTELRFYDMSMNVIEPKFIKKVD